MDQTWRWPGREEAESAGAGIAMDQAWQFSGGREEAGFAMESAMKEEIEEKRNENMKISKIGIWVSMAVASMVGGLVFGWWEFQFHSTNRQLWMVPFGLVLMITPIFAMMSVLISSFCTSMDHNHNSTWPAPSSDHVIQQSFSLVLMIAPIFILISVFVSSFCTSMDRISSLVSSLDHDQPPEIR